MDFKMYLSIFIYCFGITGIHNLETRSAAVCYGNTHANYITISCNTTEVIMVRSVDAMTKLSSSGCPIEQIPADQDQDCCVEDPEDCGGRYTGSVYQSYFTKCHGKQTCRSLQASWMTLTDDTFPHCNTTIYLPRTNYMVYDYSCVPIIC